MGRRGTWHAVAVSGTADSAQAVFTCKSPLPDERREATVSDVRCELLGLRRKRQCCLRGNNLTMMPERA